MWIQIRTMDGKRCAQVDNLSKLTRIDELKEKLVPLFDIESVRQRLFYRGKQVRPIIKPSAIFQAKHQCDLPLFADIMPDN